MLMPQGLDRLGGLGHQAYSRLLHLVSDRADFVVDLRLAKLSVNSSRSAFSSEILAGQV